MAMIHTTIRIGTRYWYS